MEKPKDDFILILFSYSRKKTKKTKSAFLISDKNIGFINYFGHEISGLGIGIMTIKKQDTLYFILLRK